MNLLNFLNAPKLPRQMPPPEGPTTATVNLSAPTTPTSTTANAPPTTKQTSKGSKSRSWVFTENNPQAPMNFISAPAVTFAIYAPEIGLSGTPHFQGYVELDAPRQLTYLKNHISPTAHWEIRRGSKLQAVQYVLKDFMTLDPTRPNDILTVRDRLDHPIAGVSEPILFNTWETAADTLLSLGQSKKKKTQERQADIQTRLKEGASEMDIADSDFDLWVKHFRAYSRYTTLITPPRCTNDMPFVVVLQGPTRTGKSKWALDNFPNAYWKQRSQWWCGYAGHKAVILDEFYGWLPFDFLLRMCDRYPLLVETKNGNVQFLAENIIFTTNAIPSTWYSSKCYFPAFVSRVSNWIIMPTYGDIQSYSDFNKVQWATTSTEPRTINNSTRGSFTTNFNPP